LRFEFPSPRRTRHVVAILALVLLAAVAGYAGNITYNVNRTVGAGTVTGVIQTDGTLGVLSASNIVDWSLALYAPTSSPTTYNLYGPASGNNSSVYVQGSDTTASTTQLLFNFSGTDNGYLLFQYGVGVHDGFHYYCDATFYGICVNGETDAPQYYTSGQGTTPSGNVVIGTAVPELGSLALLGSGILAAAGAVRRRFRA
jgi:hypothetical protein